MTNGRFFLPALMASGLLLGFVGAADSIKVSTTTTSGTHAPKPYTSRALRGERFPKVKKASEPKSLKKPRQPSTKSTEDKEPKTPKQSDNEGNKKTRVYDSYNYFVEACQEELISDVINGGIVQHNQYTNFIFGYCRSDPDEEGPKCTKDAEDAGFDYLPNDMKLLYIKSFCPADVDGQVSCLHGINERGREYEFHEELDKLCKDLENMMIRNDLLVEDKDNDKDNEDEEEEADQGEGATDTDATQPGFGAIVDYQTGGRPGSDAMGTVAPVAPPSPRPTSQPTPQPTIIKHPGKTTIITQPPTTSPVSTRPGAVTWGSVSSVSQPGTTTDSTTPGMTPGELTLRPTPRPTPGNNGSPPLTVVDISNPNNRNANQGSDDGPSSGGTIAAVIMIVLLGIAIVISAILLFRKRQRLYHHQTGIGRDFFFIKARKVRPSDESGTYDKTFVETNGSLASEEQIDFHGPLFGSWPVTKDDLERVGGEDGLSPFKDNIDLTYSPDTPRRDALGDIDEEDEEYPTDFSPSTYTSSLLSSFFSKTIDFRHNKNKESTPSNNAVDEIKRAIDDGLWQDVYYLASKMAAEGNIDSNENLQTALVRTKESSNNYAMRRPTVSRVNLTPEDEARAAQLDVSLVAGDWITLAARAAVFAALDSANNPVPSCISFVPKGNQGKVDECLEKATAALKEVQKAAKAKEEMQKQQGVLALEAAEEEEYEDEDGSEEQIVFVSADEESTSGEFEYPEEDYSDFERTVSSREREQNAAQRNNNVQTVVEDVDEESSSEDEEETGTDNYETGSYGEESVTSETRSNIPGPPSIAMSNQSTIPTQSSQQSFKKVPFASIEDCARGPFRRDFDNGISHPMEQKDEPELPIDPARAIM